MKVQISCKSFLESRTCELNPLDLICTLKFYHKKIYMFFLLCVISNMLKTHNCFKSYMMIHATIFILFFEGISNAMQFVSIQQHLHLQIMI
jgi:hypothetical protein